MAILPMLPTTLPSKGCLMSQDQARLQSIHQPGYQIGIWKRQLSAELQAEAEGLLGTDGESFRFSGPVEELSEQLRTSRAGALLQSEVLSLASWFAQLMGGQPLRLFFGKVEKDMCRRFHTDINTLRLLCTYQGPGTLWAHPDAIDHHKVAKGTNEEMIRDPAGIYQANTGEVLLIKGALHERSTYGAALHRSPAVQKSGQSRLLLRIDTGGAFNFQ